MPRINSPLKGVVDEIAIAMKEQGKRPSLEAISRRLVDMGIVSPVTGEGYTRQAISNIISKSAVGRGLLAANHRRFRQVVVNSPGWENFVQWVIGKFPEGRLINPEDLTISDVRMSDVYGFPPLPVGLYAKTIWIPVIGYDLVSSDAPMEVYLSGTVELRGYKFKAKT